MENILIVNILLFYLYDKYIFFFSYYLLNHTSSQVYLFFKIQEIQSHKKRALRRLYHLKTLSFNTYLISLSLSLIHTHTLPQLLRLPHQLLLHIHHQLIHPRCHNCNNHQASHNKRKVKYLKAIDDQITKSNFSD